MKMLKHLLYVDTAPNGRSKPNPRNEFERGADKQIHVTQSNHNNKAARPGPGAQLLVG